MSKEKSLLARPMKQPASDAPVIDEYTRKMTAAWRKSIRPSGDACGTFTCRCNVTGPWGGFRLSEGGEFYISSLGVHSLAYHRGEISREELESVKNLPFEGEDPREGELKKPNGGPWALGWFSKGNN